ncbi:MAG: SH3 domain-containing protein [Candidatus Omnitrophica bacterium]|nr:SH3 domain-containing protein [Candidatus Omnitrophota bacterium]
MSLNYPLKVSSLVLASLALFFSFCCAEDLPFSGEINADNINLRADATTTAAVLSVLDKGERLEVILEQYEWYKVRLPKSLALYIKKSLATCIKYTESQPAAPTTLSIKQCVSAKVLGERVNIRSKPSESAPIVGVADRNEIVNVISELGDWYKIEPIQNSFGWVHKRFINKASVLTSAQTLKPAQDEESNILLVGTVKPYGVVFMRSATHKLLTADNQIFLLKGNRSTLNALNHQKVKVIGKIISATGAKYPIIEVKIIEVVS